MHSVQCLFRFGDGGQLGKGFGAKVNLSRRTANCFVLSCIVLRLFARYFSLADMVGFTRLHGLSQPADEPDEEDDDDIDCCCSFVLSTCSSEPANELQDTEESPEEEL